jgi:hypothetical protein
MKEIIILGKPNEDSAIGKQIIKERKQLIEKLEKNKIPFEIVNKKWPRDYFVNHLGNIYTKKQFENYGDGGFILNYPEFTLACSEVYKNEDGRSKHSVEKRHEILKELYGNNLQIFSSPDLRLNRELSPHIDMVLLPIPQRKVLFVDKNYYRSNKKDITRFCEKNSLKIELVINNYETPSWPCNSLLFGEDGDLTAITNSNSEKSFNSRLKNYDIKIIDIPFMSNCFKGGSIHCATNTVPEDKLEEIIEYLNNTQ